MSPSFWRLHPSICFIGRAVIKYTLIIVNILRAWVGGEYRARCEVGTPSFLSHFLLAHLLSCFSYDDLGLTERGKVQAPRHQAAALHQHPAAYDHHAESAGAAARRFGGRRRYWLFVSAYYWLVSAVVVVHSHTFSEAL